ncbi:hypothetical protein K502DRAFT_331056 [Neoconidiobolus thromboides FSU 785]|nr:hypothetical protein K502DRAFT_331056 [Neoconidiobolus thromboides FSU 785]
MPLKPNFINQIINIKKQNPFKITKRIFQMKNFILLTLQLIALTSVFSQKCPLPTDSCQVGFKTFKYTDPAVPPCWLSVGTSWKCYSRNNGICNVAFNQVDIKSCTNPTPKPVCPLVSDVCKVNNILLKPNDPTAPLCWIKGIDGWQCSDKINNSCDAAKGQMDVTACNLPPPIPICPKATDTCINGSSTFVANDPTAPSCWSKTISGWICQVSISGVCDPLKGQLNISTCNIPPPIPACPKAIETCVSSTKTFLANDPKAPLCWFKTNLGWACQPSTDAGCDINKGQLNITTCNIPPPVPDCPKATDTCTNGTLIFSANSPNVPKCWSKTASGWNCEGNTNTICDSSKGQLDISICNIPPPVPTCPKATDICSNGFESFVANNQNAPHCWMKSSSGWVCQGSAGVACDAMKGQLDIITCNFPPPIPTCPKPTETCDFSTTAFTANDPNAPKCWSKSTSGWICQGSASDICDATKGQLNISTCNIPPLIPTCPKPTETCSSGTRTFLANDPNVPRCWSKVTTGWICQVATNAKCDVAKGQLDINSCNIPPPVPTCPKAVETCSNGNAVFAANDPNAPKCWSKSTSGWTCGISNNFGCDTSKGQLDITTCNISPPIPACPKATDACSNGNSTFVANDPNVPKCWSKIISGWNCQGSVKIACDSSKGQLDISTCNLPLPIPACPKATDICSNGNVTFAANDPNAPRCWSKTTLGWSCQGNSNPTCDTSKGQLDISTCNIPPPIPNCPKAIDTCKSGDVIFAANSLNAPKCWIKTTSGWICQGNLNTMCDISKGQLDIKSCNIPPAIIPDCPKATEACSSGTTSFKANDLNVPKCWSKSSSGTWICLNGSNGKCDATINQLDITTCNILPPIPDCPKATDTCNSGSAGFTANDPNAPKCWSKTSSGWSCQGDFNSKCDNSKGQLDIKACNISPPPVPKCPTSTDICNFQGQQFSPSSINAPSCWAANANGWSCIAKVNGQCNALKGEKDISTCSFPKPPVTCPTKNDYCWYGYYYFYASESFVPTCWTKTNYGWSCSFKSGASCVKDQVDIKTCSIQPPNNCPANYDKCYDSYGRSYYRYSYGTPKCWSKSYFGWFCRNSRNGCSSSETDITTC